MSEARALAKDCAAIVSYIIYYFFRAWRQFEDEVSTGSGSDWASSSRSRVVWAETRSLPLPVLTSLVRFTIREAARIRPTPLRVFSWIVLPGKESSRIGHHRAQPSLTVGLLTRAARRRLIAYLPSIGAAVSFFAPNSGRASNTSSAYFTFPNGADTCTP